MEDRLGDVVAGELEPRDGLAVSVIGDCRSLAVFIRAVAAHHAGLRGGKASGEPGGVFAADATEGLERHDEQDDADARAGKVCRGANMPRRGEEASVDRRPVPEHGDLAGARL